MPMRCTIIACGPGQSIRQADRARRLNLEVRRNESWGSSAARAPANRCCFVPSRLRRPQAARRAMAGISSSSARRAPAMVKSYGDVPEWSAHQLAHTSRRTSTAAARSYSIQGMRRRAAAAELEPGGLARTRNTRAPRAAWSNGPRGRALALEPKLLFSTSYLPGSTPFSATDFDAYCCIFRRAQAHGSHDHPRPRQLFGPATE